MASATLIRPGIRPATLEESEINSAIRYCEIDTDWYISAEVSAAGNRVEFYIQWCVNRSELFALICQELACIDFTPATWGNEEYDKVKWHSVENVEPCDDSDDLDIPDDSLYFCRYLLTNN